MIYPTLFVNHGGGPLPLLGQQTELVHHMKQAVSQWLPIVPPKSIVVISAHWESSSRDYIEVSSCPNPAMIYDYYGFPAESYRFQYPAPGNVALAEQIQSLINHFSPTTKSNNNNHHQERTTTTTMLDPKKPLPPARLNPTRGYDHGVFVPLMIMYPQANIPVVSVSLHSSLSAEIHWNLGLALGPLREEGVLILGSGYTFHNLPAFFHPSSRSIESSIQFNNWLKETLLLVDQNDPSGSCGKGGNKETSQQFTPSVSNQKYQELKRQILNWEQTAPEARQVHPREEHLLPLFVVAAAGCERRTTTAATTAMTTNGSVDGQDGIRTSNKNNNANENTINRNGTVVMRMENDDEWFPPKATLIYDSTVDKQNEGTTGRTVTEHAVSGYLFE